VSSRSDAAAAISSSSPVIGDPPHTHQSPRTLAAFRPWGGWRDNAVRGVTGQCSQPRDPDVPQPGHRRFRVSFAAEDSPSGLGRTLGKRVGGNPSRVRISYPPPVLTSQNVRANPTLGLALGRELTVTPGQPGTPAHLRTSRLTRCANRAVISFHPRPRRTGPHQRKFLSRFGPWPGANKQQQMRIRPMPGELGGRRPRPSGRSAPGTAGYVGRWRRRSGSSAASRCSPCTYGSH
jgi:hypothetical protein